MVEEPSEEAEEFADALMPIYPAGQGRAVWAMQRHIGEAVAPRHHRRAAPTPCPRSCGPARASALAGRPSAIHRPRRSRDVTRAAQAAQVRRGLRAADRARRNAGWPPRLAGDAAAPARRRDAGRLRRAAAVRAHARVSSRWGRRSRPTWRSLIRCTGCFRARSARARPWWRCGRCSQVVDAGGQAALLAPTEVLAQQHHRSISAMLGPLADRRHARGDGTRVALLTGSLGAAARRAALLDAASGAAGIVVGTHAVLQERSSSPISAWSWSTSSTGSASSSATRCARRARRPARAGHDGHPDPAHGRDDGLRRPRGLHARPAARGPRADHHHVVPAGRSRTSRPGVERVREEVARAGRPTSCARASD